MEILKKILKLNFKLVIKFIRELPAASAGAIHR